VNSLPVVVAATARFYQNAGCARAQRGRVNLDSANLSKPAGRRLSRARLDAVFFSRKPGKCIDLHKKTLRSQGEKTENMPLG